MHQLEAADYCTGGHATYPRKLRMRVDVHDRDTFVALC